MIDLATAPRARIYTTWGTVLFVDADTGELRHGPIDTSPENAVFVADPISTGAHRQGWLMFASGEKLEPIACGSLGCRSVSAADPGDPPVAATLLELIPLERGLITFGAERHFLGAQPDGSLDLSKPWCSTWELFLASEDWCSAPLAAIEGHSSAVAGSPFNWRGIADLIIDARLRAQANANSKATKILIYGYPAWSHGRVYYDLCKALHNRGYIVDIIHWQINHAHYMNKLISYYDLFIVALDGLQTLLEVYRVPPEKVIGLSHHEMDIQILIDQMGRAVFERLAGYGVVSYPLYDASAIFGVPRHPLVVPLGVNCDEFYAETPERLTTIGYAGSYSHKTRDGLEWKRGDLAEAAAREAGLEFKIAGSTGNQISFHDMPEFYKSVEAVLVSSLTEGAGLPAREAAAAGRLVISTPVGDFPLLASQGIGIMAPIEAHKYRDFVTATLKRYKDSQAEFLETCRKAQDAARQLDWQYMIGNWIELIEAAKAHAGSYRSSPDSVKRVEAYAPKSVNKADQTKVPKLTVYCVAYKRYDKIAVLVHSFMCQTYCDFRLVVIHDGHDAEMQELLAALKKRYPARLDYFFTENRFNDHGHSLRAIAIEQCNSEFIMITNDDNYYVPVFLEKMFEKIDGERLEFVLCDMVHNYDWRPRGGKDSYNAFITEPRKDRVDIGCFIVKTAVAKEVGFRDRSFAADGTFVDDIMAFRGGVIQWGKVDKVLFVHN
jgi:glycosyltransferase involved in cell wall biosynthesis